MVPKSTRTKGYFLAKTGKPTNSWEDHIRKIADPTWTRMARYRIE